MLLQFGLPDLSQSKQEVDDYLCELIGRYSQTPLILIHGGIMLSLPRGSSSALSWETITKIAGLKYGENADSGLWISMYLFSTLGN